MTTSAEQINIDAFTTVYKALLPLEREARQRVIDGVLAILGQQASSSLNQPIAPAAPHPPAATPPSQMSIEDFVSSKKPKDTYQRLACLAYFLEHHEGKKDFFAADLTKANQDARQVKISNIKVFLDNATRTHGFFAPVGKGKKQLTARGAAAVKALPDQEAVKRGLQDHPLPKKSGRRSKATKKSKSK